MGDDSLVRTGEQVGGRPRRGGDVDISSVAALMADRSRGRILMSLNDGRALPASVLAHEAGIAATAASNHLKKLVEGSLLEVEQIGRHRYYTLKNSDVAVAIEKLASISDAHQVTSLKQGTKANAVRMARTCYDHLAGKLGVDVAQALLDHGAITRIDGEIDTGRGPGDPMSAAAPQCPYTLAATAASKTTFASIGVDITELDDAGRSRRPVLLACVDWSEQRHHLAGRLGALLVTRWLETGWIERRPRSRAVKVTDTGCRRLESSLGIVWLTADAASARS